MKRPVTILSAFAAFAGCNAASPSYARQLQGTSPFTLTPTTHVCVSARISEDMPGMPSTPEAVHDRSSWLTGEIRGIVQPRHPQDLYYQFLTFRSPECSSNPDNINIHLKYSLNSKGKPFRVEWSITQGSKRVERDAEHDIEQEVATGKRFRFHKENLIATALSEDIRARAAEIAALIK